MQSESFAADSLELHCPSKEVVNLQNRVQLLEATSLPAKWMNPHYP
jgi:hypothetical protein